MNFDHKCSVETPTIKINKDKTYVCEECGLCFSQVVCDEYYNFRKTNPEVYSRRVNKKNQQAKNSTLTVAAAMKIIKSLNLDERFSGDVIGELSTQIVKLWLELLSVGKVKYVHRKDKNAFVVSICYSLGSGICNNKGIYVVVPHRLYMISNLDRKKRSKPNQEKKYIHLIRYGLIFIRNGFRNRTEIKNKLSI